MMARILRITALIVAGEMVYALPFNTQRFFKATLLEAFGITNTELGDMFGAYGVMAIIAYLLGGPFADRYSARTLMAVSLVMTSIGGLYMAQFPGPRGMTLLYAYWGVTTVFLFWAALIKATRDWGGDTSQGIAFGILDGGRGFAAAVAAGIGIAILALYLPGQGDFVDNTDRQAGLRMVIYYYSALTLLCAAMVWFLVPHDESTVSRQRNPFSGFSDVLRNPLVWGQAAVIVCAYCAYKGLDNYTLYAVQVLGHSEIDASKLATTGAYLRPVACVVAGLVADRFDSGRTIAVLFGILVAAYAALGSVTPDTVGMTVIYGNLFVTFFAAYALRGIYHALLKETQTPKHRTGAAVAVIAFVGYTPEVFFGPITGRILDASPGLPGHLDYFRFLAAVMVVGVAVALILVRMNRRARAGRSVLVQ